MKNFFRCLVSLLILTAIVPSCEKVSDCETCKHITNDKGTIYKSAGIIYCGSELEKKKNAGQTTINNVTTYWECN